MRVLFVQSKTKKEREIKKKAGYVLNSKVWNRGLSNISNSITLKSYLHAGYSIKYSVPVGFNFVQNIRNEVLKKCDKLEKKKKKTLKPNERGSSVSM